MTKGFKVDVLDVMFIVLLVWTCVFVALVMWADLFVGLLVGLVMSIGIFISYKQDWIQECYRGCIAVLKEEAEDHE